MASLPMLDISDDWVPESDLIVRPNFIDEAEHQELLLWARSMRSHLRDNGPGRTYEKVNALPETPAIYHEVRHRLQDMLGLERDIAPEPMFGWYLSVISEGGNVHPHRDPTTEGKRHLRCNLFLQLPRQGGLPIIERRPVTVEPRSLLAFYPSERWHSSQRVIGNLRRIILSFGYLVPDDYVIPQ